MLHESGTTMTHVYFPTTAIVSLLYVMENGASAEIAVVGNEGLVGIALFMGGESTPSRAVVQSAGKGYRMPSKALKDEFKLAPVLHLLLRYTQALITQMAQTAVCNRHHSLDQQLCRWLLLSLDRLKGDDLVMTQELISNMLGVRREGGHRGRAQIAEGGAHQIRTRSYHCAGPAGFGGAHLRVLRGRQKGVRPIASCRRSEVVRVSSWGSDLIAGLLTTLSAPGPAMPSMTARRWRICWNQRREAASRDDPWVSDGHEQSSPTLAGLERQLSSDQGLAPAMARSCHAPHAIPLALGFRAARLLAGSG